ncbi:hypothetical protein [Dietzia sp. 179-F 9C3 NHS]|uniref:hypothetical protein n=1 Tax=Dietzia sp. 179-F 9C3 NHS TaxID=3374295 RepID=UPI003879186C
MDEPTPSLVVDAVRRSLAEHGVELLHEKVAAWLRWIQEHRRDQDNNRGGPATKDLDAHEWCHLILYVHEAAPKGPDSLTTDDARSSVARLVDKWLGIHYWNLLCFADTDDLDDDTDDLDEEDDEPVTIVLPLAVFTKALAVMSLVSASTNALISACVEAHGAPPTFSATDPMAIEDYPELVEMLAVQTRISQLTSVSSIIAGLIRDTAGDIEVQDSLVEKIIEELQRFCDLDVVRDLHATPLEPAFLGTVRDLAVRCADTVVQLGDALEMADLA